jgi:IS1 family transposase
MNKLSTAKRAAVIAALVEGNSIRATSRITNVSKPTVLKLLADLGRVCAEYHDYTVWNLKTVRVQCDEIWSFCYAKAKNVPVRVSRAAAPGTVGDVWTWTAIDADSKLIISYHVGDRSGQAADYFVSDLAQRVRNDVQITTDAHKPYLAAVKLAFEDRKIDYATLQKVYAGNPNETRYSPAKIVSSTTEAIKGTPDPRHISTSYVERQNLTMRMSMRRYTRLTNAFSKKIDNHIAAVNLHFLHYNFCRIHQTLRVTPAMAAGLSRHVWGIMDIVALLEATENKAA